MLTFQRCTTHIKRNMLAHVKHGDKKELADDMSEVFKTGDKAYTLEDGVQAWKGHVHKMGKALQANQENDRE